MFDIIRFFANSTVTSPCGFSAPSKEAALSRFKTTWSIPIYDSEEIGLGCTPPGYLFLCPSKDSRYVYDERKVELIRAGTGANAGVEGKKVTVLVASLAPMESSESKDAAVDRGGDDVDTAALLKEVTNLKEDVKKLASSVSEMHRQVVSLSESIEAFAALIASVAGNVDNITRFIASSGAGAGGAGDDAGISSGEIKTPDAFSTPVRTKSSAMMISTPSPPTSSSTAAAAMAPAAEASRLITPPPSKRGAKCPKAPDRGRRVNE